MRKPRISSRSGGARLLAGALWLGPGLAAAQTPTPTPTPVVTASRPQLQRRWLAEHLIADLSAVAGWRSAWSNDRHEGFEARAGGGEINLGLEFRNTYGVVLGARVLAGTASDPRPRMTMDTLYFLEALGHVGLQIRFTEIFRISAGPTLGLVRRWDDGFGPQEWLVMGGLLRLGADVLPLPVLPRAVGVWLRLDLSGPLSDPEATLPKAMVSLAFGAGVRI